MASILADTAKGLMALYYQLFTRVDYIEDKDSAPSNDIGVTSTETQFSKMDQRSLSEFQIASVLRRERYFRDTRDWQKLRNCYHPLPSRTRIEVGAFKGNIDGFMNLSMMTTPSGLAILHPTTLVDVQIRDNKAVAISIDTALNRFEHRGRLYDLTSWTRTVSRMTKINGVEWKLCHWETIYNRDQLASVDSKDALPEMRDLESLRRPYRFLAWFISTKGIQMPSDLPGDDDPQSVSEVFKNSKTWLEQDE